MSQGVCVCVFTYNIFPLLNQLLRSSFQVLKLELICKSYRESNFKLSFPLLDQTPRLFQFRQGQLHIQAKSQDHEIVRAQKKCPKAVTRHFQNV